MAFSLRIYPWVYQAQFDGQDDWKEEWNKKPHLSPAQEENLSLDELQELLAKRNSFPELPLVNYTTQYGVGCFEGVKAFPQPDGQLKLFRPDRNAHRMHKSMQGLLMPAFPKDRFIKAALEIVKKNADLGFRTQYRLEWEKDSFQTAEAVYLRPFSYCEPAIGLGISTQPWVIMVCTPVSSYFKEGSTAAVTTNRIRATPKGTGWIKCSGNYVIPILAKKEAEDAGYMEVIFLDSTSQRFIEEGSSCNFFALLETGVLVTPELEDTILPGITRESILTLAQDMGLKTEERKLPLQEVLETAQEVFVTGTAAGVSFLQSITHGSQTKVFNNGKIGNVTQELAKTLKGIQYGLFPDKFQWMVGVS